MSSPHTVLVQRILARHGASPDRRLWAQDTKYGYVGRPKGRTNGGHIILQDAYPVRFGLCEGSADIVGLLTVPVQDGDRWWYTAVFVGLEAKTGKATAKPHQRRWLELIVALGGIAGVVRSPEDVDELLGPPMAR